jgi:[citrate (pro-3S)-lyase] ligase
MQRVLPPFDIEPVEIERAEGRGEPISASRVRAALRAGELAGIEALVPASTLSFLQSQDARPIRERLLIAEGRHE